MRGCDQVFHLAALIAFPYSYIAPASYIDTNIHGTLNVMQAARDLGISRVVHTSTSETYGPPSLFRLQKSMLRSVSRLTLQAKSVLSYVFIWRSFNTPVSVLRPFNTYGPRQVRGNADYYHPISIWTAPNTFGCSFSYTRLQFCCRYLLHLSYFNLRAALGQVLNAASNFEISIGDTATLIAQVMNVDLEIVTDEQRIRPQGSEVNRLFGDNTLLRQLTAWKPAYGGIEGFRLGLVQTAEWFSDPENLSYYRPGTYMV